MARRILLLGSYICTYFASIRQPARVIVGLQHERYFKQSNYECRYPSQSRSGKTICSGGMYTH